MTSEAMSMHLHPDIMELRAKHERYELAGMEPAAQGTTGLLFLTGIFIAMSAWVCGFTQYSTLTVSNLVVGIALAVLALGFASMYGRIHGIGWTAPVLGVWTIISPWIVSGGAAHTASIWSNVAAGAVAVVLGLSSLGLGVFRSRAH